MGVFLPLIAVNCAILGAALFMVNRDYTLGDQFGHLAFHVDDLEAVVADVEKRGWWYRRSKAGRPTKYIFVKDPNGYDIEILESKKG